MGEGIPYNLHDNTEGKKNPDTDLIRTCNLLESDALPNLPPFLRATLKRWE
jgi:hypothetical protein